VKGVVPRIEKNSAGNFTVMHEKKPPELFWLMSTVISVEKRGI